MAEPKTVLSICYDFSDPKYYLDNRNYLCTGCYTPEEIANYKPSPQEIIARKYPLLNILAALGSHHDYAR